MDKKINGGIFMYISEIVTTPPENVSERVPLEQEVYKVFKKLGIS